MSEIRVKPAEWQDLIKQIYRYNCLLVKLAYYKHTGTMPKDFEEFKSKVLQFVDYHIKATATKLHLKPAMEFKVHADNVKRELPSHFEEIIQDCYKKFIAEAT